MVNITFSSELKEEILNIFDKKVNEEGIIVEQENEEISVRTVEGNEISIDEFGGIKKGSEIFIKNDLVSLMNFSRDK